MGLNKKLKDAYQNEVTPAPHPLEFEAKVDLKDTTKKRTTKTIIKIVSLSLAGTVALMVLIPLSVFFISAFRWKNSYKSLSTFRYRSEDVASLKSDTFKVLNNITYDELTQPDLLIDSTFLDNVNNFSSDLYHALDLEKNVCYSPFNVYANMDLVSLAVSDDEISNQLNSLLGSSSLRETEISKVLLNNFYQNQEDQTNVKLRSATFIDAQLGAKDEFVDALTHRRSEAYELDFQNDRDLTYLFDWIANSIGEDNFLSKKDLDINEFTTIGFFNSLLFKGKWATSYNTTKTRDDIFYKLDGTEVSKTFINHTIYSYVFEDDKFVSTIDNYLNGYSIEYIVPKSLEDNIFSLTENMNVFTWRNNITPTRSMVNLFVPKFTLTSFFSLKDAMSSLGLEKLYDKEQNVLTKAFKNGDSLEVSCLADTKQKTTIELNEDGTTAKSITFSMGFGATSAGQMDDGFEIKLNQPFIYIIRDKQNVPILTGTYVIPN